MLHTDDLYTFTRERTNAVTIDEISEAQKITKNLLRNRLTNLLIVTNKTNIIQLKWSYLFISYESFTGIF